MPIPLYFPGGTPATACLAKRCRVLRPGSGPANPGPAERNVRTSPPRHRAGPRSCFKNPVRGWPRGRVVKFARSAAGGPVFRRFESWARTWHCSSDHAEAASHMPQLEEPTTKNTQLCTGGLWGEKGKNKIFKKKIQWQRQNVKVSEREENNRPRSNGVKNMEKTGPRRRGPRSSDFIRGPRTSTISTPRLWPTACVGPLESTRLPSGPLWDIVSSCPERWSCRSSVRWGPSGESMGTGKGRPREVTESEVFGGDRLF